MKLLFKLLPICFLLFFACQKHENPKTESHEENIQVNPTNHTIKFLEKESIVFFKTQEVQHENITADITAPAKISATILASNEGASQNIVLFEHPELADNYTLLIQHQSNILQIQNINIKQKQIELERIKDLQAHGAATGQDLLNAQTALAMEQTNLAN